MTAIGMLDGLLVTTRSLTRSETKRPDDFRSGRKKQIGLNSWAKLATAHGLLQLLLESAARPYRKCFCSPNRPLGNSLAAVARMTQEPTKTHQVSV
jgi:hypothetical protein